MTDFNLEIEFRYSLNVKTKDNRWTVHFDSDNYSESVKEFNSLVALTDVYTDIIEINLDNNEENSVEKTWLRE